MIILLRGSFSRTFIKPVGKQMEVYHLTLTVRRSSSKSLAICHNWPKNEATNFLVAVWIRLTVFRWKNPLCYVYFLVIGVNPPPFMMLNIYFDWPQLKNFEGWLKIGLCLSLEMSESTHMWFEDIPKLYSVQLRCFHIWNQWQDVLTKFTTKIHARWNSEN